MKKKELRLKNHSQFVKEYIPEVVRNTSAEACFRQLETMFENAHRLNQPDPDRGAEKAEVRELWRLLKERFHASN
jgi:hypothetical protein